LHVFSQKIEHKSRFFRNQITLLLSDIIKTKLKNCLGSEFIDLFVFPHIFSIYFARI
jgi:hypothetical protein